MEQYAKWPPMTERQIDQMQEQLFHEYGPFFHLSTKPLQDGLIFECEEERKVALNLIAILAKETHVDILAFAMQTLKDYRIVGHVHDEVIIECPPETPVSEICDKMGQAPPWIPGLLLRADGYECDFYRKD